MAASEPSFERFGPEPPVSPVVLSVPHAGRDYPMALRAALRVPLASLHPLEDRFVDLVALAARDEETTFVQRRARAWIDLNRDEGERDPKLDEGASAASMPIESVKIRSGLGLVPRRVAQAGEIWRRRLSADEVDARIAQDHRPYHHAVQAALGAARARFGIAVLLDVHSMPPLAKSGAQIVLGDRFGRSAASRFLARLEAVARAGGLRVGLNSPYAGGHILDRHGAPAKGVHAVQLEIDRSLYLNAALDTAGGGLPTAANLLRAMIDALADEALGSSEPMAAE